MDDKEVVEMKVIEAIERLETARPNHPLNPPSGLPATVSNIVAALNTGEQGSPNRGMVEAALASLVEKGCVRVESDVYKRVSEC